MIDTHAHWMPPQVAERVAAAADADERYGRRFGSLLGPLRDRLTNIGELLASMDAAGIDQALVSVPPPAATVHSDQPQARLAEEFNDTLVNTVAAHSGRLMAVIGLPLTEPTWACHEVRRWADDPRVAGVCVPVSVGGTGIDASTYEPFYRLCAEAGLPIFLHPALDEPSAQFAEWNLHSAVAAPLATTVAATRLALSGMLDRVSNLTVVVPHLGGAIPFLFGRLADQSVSDATVRDLAYYFRERMFYDTCAFHPPALHCAAKTIGSERLLLGSDYPFRGHVSRAVADIVDALDGTERQGVLGANAQRLLTVRTAGL